MRGDKGDIRGFIPVDPPGLGGREGIIPLVLSPDPPSPPPDAAFRGVVIAIDPGASGAVAVMTPGGHLLRIVDMPTVKVGTKTRVAPQALALMLAAVKPEQAFVEMVASRPGQGVASMFAFGQAVGVLDGVLAALGVPVTYVTPQSWKKWAQVSADKGSSRRRAMQLFPGLAADFQRVKDDGRAEAALIGLYGLRHGGRADG